MWRALSNCIPTMDRLLTRRIDVSSLCPVCGSAEESVLHILVSCPLSAQVWNRVGTAQISTSSFFQWVWGCFQTQDQEKQSLLAVVCWALWGARNKVVWNRVHTSAAAILTNASRFLYQWCSAQNFFLDTPPSSLAFGEGAESWKPPSDQ